MSYLSKIQESIEDAHNRHIATKIIDSMKELRQNPNERSPRRWIWELVQNAKDVAHENSTVSIEISFSHASGSGQLEFKHNGKPFSIKNLTFLIEQVSTKERDLQDDEKRKETGKFGTGFLTTHLLSEKVQLESIVQEDDEPFKKVNLTLDRSGRTLNEIIESVRQSHAQINEIVSGSSYEGYSPTEYNTIFRYELDSKGIVVAEKGLQDLQHSVFFTLVFLPIIKTIYVAHENAHYELDSEILVLHEDISIYSITKTTPFEQKKTQIAVLSRNHTTIAVEIECVGHQIFIKEFSPSTPKLFCDFPLVGSELFPFPVVINSTAFNPTEPRDSVRLTDIEEKEVQENKSILLEAINLYHILLEYASSANWGNIYVLTQMPKELEKDGVSKTWFEKNVLFPLKNKILTIPVVDTENHGRVSISSSTGSIMFPSASTKELRNGIWELCNQWVPNRLPRKADVEIWAQIKWLGVAQLTLTFLTQQIEKREGLGGLSEALVTSNDPIKWLNSFFEIIQLDNNFLREVINDTYAVIPNQNGEFKKRSELKSDDNIDEELKNVLLMLGIDCRKYLRHKEVDLNCVTLIIKTQEEIVLEINKLLKENRQNDDVIPVYHYLISLFSEDKEFPQKRESIYDICRGVFSNTIVAKRNITNWSEDIWREADRSELILVIQTIVASGNMKSLGDILKLDKSQTVDWIDNFISFLMKNEYQFLLTHKKAAVFPNQKGIFMHVEQVFLDDGEIDDTLKDISALLGHDFRDELLELDILLELPDSRVVTEEMVAREILNLVTPRLSETPRTEETKAIFKKLFLWLRANGDKAEKYFRNIHTHKFIDDDEIASNMREVEILSEIKEEFGVDLTDIKQILEATRLQTDLNERLPITKETLASLGISSITELEEAMKDKEIADKLIHTSTSTEEMLHYAQKIIARAKERILKFLGDCPEYDCREFEETYNTIIGGIKKNGTPIYIVARPSDGHKVIIFSSAERDVLEHEPTAELWVADGITEPMQLTLGRVLKNTGINRIPL